jgi:DNA-binding beta-propeller fold protein YncE
VATDSRGYVYAEDLQTSTLEQYGPGGVLTAKVVGPALEGMAVDRSGYIYGLTFGGTVQVLKPVRGSRPTAGIVRQWVLPGYGRGTGGLVPSGIAVDGKGNVYVADIRFGAIKKFTTAGKLLATWGAKPGSAPGRFRYPGGLATDARGHVFVLDSGNNRVQELDGSGHVLGVWGRWGEGLAQFMRPHGIATDPRGNVYVGDTFNDRIQELTFGA